MMRFSIVSCATLLIFVAAAIETDKPDKQNKVVCYFGSWAVYRPSNGKISISDLEPNLCTHMIYTFIGITLDGAVRALDPWADLADDGGMAGYDKFNALRGQNPNMKTLMAIGGWNEGSTKYSQVVGNSKSRSNLVSNIVAFVKKHNFDGCDLDWEYPNQRGGSEMDRQNFVLLVKELRKSFDQHGLILSAAVAAGKNSASLSYDIPQISKYLDFINLMTYDFHGSWDATTGHNAPLYASARDISELQKQLNINAAVRYWLSQGAPAKKLILGIPLYGRSFTLADKNKNEPGAVAIGAGQAGSYTRENGMLGYNEICELESQGWTSAWDAEQRVPYAYRDNQWVSYDNVKSVTEKAEFALSMGLGGVMVWSVETDDFRGICKERFPLLKALNQVIRNGQFSSTIHPPSQIIHSNSSFVLQESKTPKPQVPSSVQPRTVTEACQNGFLYVRDPKDCSKFYICQKIDAKAFKISPFSCSAGLYFDTAINVCNYRNLVQCD
ncbi:chitinase-3-like protein 1 [Athalia rosae]|uniref:chitinase-3-like protein 1 n=1 Tax=Athalia rosae TaxID=37344 RepID=UPI0020343D5B|nr:chitinase-3-like protein 1 [Athalia rosae]